MLNHKGVTCECFRGKNNHIFHCSFDNTWMTGRLLYMTVSTGSMRKRIPHFKYLLFIHLSILSFILSYYCAAPTADIQQANRKVLKTHIDQMKLCSSLSALVSLIFFSPRHTEVQSQPPCINSAGALALADNSSKDFHQS